MNFRLLTIAVFLGAFAANIPAQEVADPEIQDATNTAGTETGTGTGTAVSGGTA